MPVPQVVSSLAVLQPKFCDILCFRCVKIYISELRPKITIYKNVDYIFFLMPSTSLLDYTFKQHAFSANLATPGILLQFTQVIAPYAMQMYAEV